MVDDIHERTVNTDIILGLLKKIRKKRKKEGNPLKIIISSATMQAEELLNYLTGEGFTSKVTNYNSLFNS